MTNTALNIFDAIFTALDEIEQIDYIALGEKAIAYAATFAAFIVATATYVYTALRLFWLDNGEQILTFAFVTIFNAADFAHDLYIAGGDLRKFVNLSTAYIADSAYYLAAAY